MFKALFTVDCLKLDKNDQKKDQLILVTNISHLLIFQYQHLQHLKSKEDKHP